jgi:hypothetical protein
MLAMDLDLVGRGMRPEGDYPGGVEKFPSTDFRAGGAGLEQRRFRSAVPDMEMALSL